MEVLRLFVWNLSALSIKMLRQHLFAFEYLHIRRVRQPNGTCRFDMFVDKLSFIRVEEALTGQIHRLRGKVTLATTDPHDGLSWSDHG
jgi:hypothetical protein